MQAHMADRSVRAGRIIYADDDCTWWIPFVLRRLGSDCDAH
jgi:hypothetical protein